MIRCIPNVCEFLLPLEEIIRTKFLPSLTGQCTFSDAERDLLALPPRLGGLGIINPASYSSFQFSSSVSITAPLVEQILQQSTTCSADVLSSQFAAKQQVINNRSQFLSDTYDSLLSSLPSKLQRSILLSSEEGSSSWLTALPLADHIRCDDHTITCSYPQIPVVTYRYVSVHTLHNSCVCEVVSVCEGCVRCFVKCIELCAYV